MLGYGRSPTDLALPSILPTYHWLHAFLFSTVSLLGDECGAQGILTLSTFLIPQNSLKLQS